MSIAAPESEVLKQVDPVERVMRDPEFWEYASEQFATPQQHTVQDETGSDRLDLQRPRIEATRHRREELMELLMTRPADAFMQEVTYLAATCYADRIQADGTFFTRENGTQRLDSLTTISDTPDGKVTVFRHRMFAPVTYGYNNRVEITATTDGFFCVRTEVSDKGFTRMADITGSSEARSIMEEYFASSLRAAGAVQGRSPKENAVADQDAQARYQKLNRSELRYLI